MSSNHNVFYLIYVFDASDIAQVFVIVRCLDTCVSPEGSRCGMRASTEGCVEGGYVLKDELLMLDMSRKRGELRREECVEKL